MPRDLGDLAVGQEWAYRKRQVDETTRVEIVKIGAAKPARVQIKFLDDAHEGRQEWVPPARLKVLWANVDEWQARENRWAAVYAASDLEVWEDHAWYMVFDYLRIRNVPLVAELDYFGTAGVLGISDVDALIAGLELEPEMLSDPVSFVDSDGTLVVPWAVAQVIVRRLAQKYADLLLAEMDAHERTRRQQNRFGHQSGKHWISAEICARVDAEMEVEYGPARELVRQWCGTEAVDRYDELLALREEVVRLGGLIERAVTVLRRADRREADAIERELGVPVGTLQHRQEQ
ncbi:hypothetical protein [Nocardia macrotermitis]|uniref:Uncharacterized protein n=1 Tax=Nocardia macrotermitis TaxID=2585198 RepID=A0A7K0D4P7_9NOCA|nr:hypothetical protein [Nocardia macrotermitis]MQY20541.1 hypothetical protein [Nocardia macrotermitis]